MPSPPIWIKINITICPERERVKVILTVVRPVVQTALVDKKTASKKLSHCPSALDIGKEIKKAPKKITVIYPSAIIKKGENLFLYNFFSKSFILIYI